MTKPPLRILSLGAGVQSTTMALMIARGDLPMVDCAIFADTGWEPEAVYKHLAWLTAQLPFPVYVVTAGNLREDALKGVNSTGHNFAAVPWFMVDRRGKKRMGKRQCTYNYKLRPMQKKIVEMLGGKRPKGGAEVLIGISTNETWRIKPSRVQYIVNTWPLIERRMSRQDCRQWLEERQYPMPRRSACLGCPFLDDEQRRAQTPAEFADTVAVDHAIRHQFPAKGQQYMHPSFVPLELVDLSTPAQQGQGDLFLNECEGMCGL